MERTDQQRIDDLEDVVERLIAALVRELGQDYASELLARLNGYK